MKYTLTMVEVKHAILVFKGVLTASTTINIPTESTNKKLIIAHHCNGKFPLYLKHTGTSSVTLQPFKRRWIFSDGQQLVG